MNRKGLSALLLALLALVIPLSRAAEPDEVFHCRFEQQCDKNYDGWPDDWTRRTGRGFPQYVTMKIARKSWPAGDRCLQVELNGGAAIAYSPPLAVDGLFSYRLQALVETSGLRHDRARLSLTLLDQENRRLQTHLGSPVGETKGWQRMRLPAIVPEARCPLGHHRLARRAQQFGRGSARPRVVHRRCCCSGHRA